MKKFIKILLMCVFALSMACVAVACGGGNDNVDKKEAGLKYKTIDGDKYIVGYVSAKDEKDVTLTIPGDVDKIKSGAFDKNSTIIKIIVPSTVKEIGAGAFKKMQSLKEIELPYVGGSIDAVNAKKTFGYIFGTEEYDEGKAVSQSYSGKGTATYYLPKTLTAVTVNAKEDTKLSDYAFYGCKDITSFTLQGKITEIGKYAFYGCYMLKNLVVPETVTSIGDYAFVDCTRLTGKADTSAEASLKFATTANLKTIGDNAFMGTKLTEFTLPEGLISIGKNCFASKVSALKVTDQSEVKTVVFPSTLKEISEYAFYFSTKLVSVKYGSGLVKVWSNAFNYCESLKLFATSGTPSTGDVGAITFASTIKIVGSNAFSNCGKKTIVYAVTGDAAIYEEGVENTFVETKRA